MGKGETPPLEGSGILRWPALPDTQWAERTCRGSLVSSDLQPVSVYRMCTLESTNAFFFL